jgi:cobalamin biosynthesis Mg chelatase CobN
MSQVFDGAADRYALDSEMADKLRKSNPEAFRNILKRMLEVCTCVTLYRDSVEGVEEWREGMGSVRSVCARIVRIV